MPMEPFHECRKNNGCKGEDGMNIKKHKHWPIGRSDIHMQSHDQGEKFNMSNLLKLSHRDE